MKLRYAFLAGMLLVLIGGLVFLSLPEKTREPVRPGPEAGEPGLVPKQERATALRLKEEFSVEVLREGDEDGQIIAILPENHNTAERDRVISLLGEIERQSPIGLIEVENYIAAPDDQRWLEVMTPYAKALRQPVESLVKPVGSGRYDSLFSSRWNVMPLERSRPQAFIDSTLLLQTAQDVDSMRKAVGMGLEVINGTDRLVRTVAYLRERHELPQVPAALQKRLTFTKDDVPYGDELQIAALLTTINVTQHERDLGFAEMLIADLNQPAHKLVIVIIGSGHVSRKGAPDIFKDKPLLTELLTPRLPKGAWLMTIKNRR